MKLIIGLIFIAVLLVAILLTARAWFLDTIDTAWRYWDAWRRPVTEFHFNETTGRYVPLFRKRKFEGEKTSYFYGGPYGALTSASDTQADQPRTQN